MMTPTKAPVATVEMKPTNQHPRADQRSAINILVLGDGECAKTIRVRQNVGARSTVASW
jgi:hypothetical protein